MLAQAVPRLGDDLVQALAWRQAVVLGPRAVELLLGVEHTPQQIGRQQAAFGADGLESRWLRRAMVAQPRQQDVGPKDVHREHGLDGDAALGARRLAHALVGGELSGGALAGDGLEGLLELRQRREQQTELLVDGGGDEVALGPRGKQALAFFRREPLRRIRRTGAGERDDLLAEDGLRVGAGDLQVIAEARHKQRGPGAHGRGGDDAAAGGHGPGVSGHRIERLIERPAGKAFDDRAGAAEVDLAFLAAAGRSGR